MSAPRGNPVSDVIPAMRDVMHEGAFSAQVGWARFASAANRAIFIPLAARPYTWWASPGSPLRCSGERGQGGRQAALPGPSRSISGPASDRYAHVAGRETEHADGPVGLFGPLGLGTGPLACRAPGVGPSRRESSVQMGDGTCPPWTYLRIPRPLRRHSGQLRLVGARRSASRLRPTSAGDLEQPPTGPGSSTALATADGSGSALLAAPEVRQFAAELATQLFQRWQAALQAQLRAELERRLAAELKHREQSGRDLAEERPPAASGTTPRRRPYAVTGGCTAIRPGRWVRSSSGRARSWLRAGGRWRRSGLVSGSWGGGLRMGA